MARGLKDEKSWATHLHKHDTIKTQPNRKVKLWMNTKKLPGTKELVHPKLAGNDFPFYVEVMEEKQIVVPCINNIRVIKKVTKHNRM